MMVNCPKCGFAQPKDQFCAKCGVDMVAFRPPELPLSKKLMSSWIFQVAVFALIILTAYFVIRDRSRSNLDERVAEIDSAPQSIAQQSSGAASGFASSSTASADAADADQPTSNGVQTSAPQQAIVPQGVQPGATGSTGTQTMPPASELQGGAGLVRAADAVLGDRGTGTAAAANVRSIRIQFTEARRGMIAELNRNTVNLASYGTNFSGGVVTNMTERLTEMSRNLRTLDAPFEYPIQMNQPIVMFKGARDEQSGTNIGLTIQITPTANDENGVQLQVEVSQVLKDSSGAPAEQNFQDNFLVPKEGGAYMAGLFNRRPLTDSERAFYLNASILKILASPAFVSQQTDFLMVIQAR